MIVFLLSEIGVIEVEHKLEEAVHLVLLHDARLADRAHNCQEALPFLFFELLYRHICHVDDHDIVAKIGFVEGDLCLVELCPGLLHLCQGHLFLLLADEVLSFAIQGLFDLAESHLGFSHLVEAFLQSLAVS